MARFYLDHDVARHLAALLTARGHETITSFRVGMHTAKDHEQLLYGAQRSWVLVTHNARDFMLLHHAWCGWAQEWGVPAVHGGILVLPGGRRTPDWLVDQVCEAVDLPMANSLYLWRVGLGWVAG